MDLEVERKINKFLKQWQRGTVGLTSWLTSNGYSSQLLNRYKKSNWIEAIGSGAMKLSGDSISVEGALYALQKQAGSSIHFGGKTALVMLGKSHYLELAHKRVMLFGGATEALPSWFTKYDWDVEVNYFSSSFLPSDFGMVEKEFKNFSIDISGAARAIMECMYLVPKQQDFIECYELMEGLNNLRPNVVQQLLEKCSSVKVKRLFLYMAEKAKHPWLEYLDLENIDLGKGNRSLTQNGVYVSKYKITVPKELESYGTL